MWFYSFCFWYEGMSIHLGAVFWNLVYKACFSHEAAEIVIPEMDFILVVLINWIAQLFWLVEYVLLVRSNGINN